MKRLWAAAPRYANISIRAVGYIVVDTLTGREYGWRPIKISFNISIKIESRVDRACIYVGLLWVKLLRKFMHRATEEKVFAFYRWRYEISWHTKTRCRNWYVPDIFFLYRSIVWCIFDKRYFPNDDRKHKHWITLYRKWIFFTSLRKKKKKKKTTKFFRCER